MGKHLLIVVGVLCGLVVGSTASEARLLPAWPYGKLMKEADLVVIATPTKTEDTKDEPPKHHWNYEFVGQNTRFKITHALKGTGKDEITVLHFKFGGLKKSLDPKDIWSHVIEDGPLHVAFQARYNTEYLLFLKARKDGRYEPLSGQIDPSLSVRRLAEAEREVKDEN